MDGWYTRPRAAQTMQCTLDKQIYLNKHIHKKQPPSHTHKTTTLFRRVQTSRMDGWYLRPGAMQATQFDCTIDKHTLCIHITSHKYKNITLWQFHLISAICPPLASSPAYHSANLSKYNLLGPMHEEKVLGKKVFFLIMLRLIEMLENIAFQRWIFPVYLK